MKFYISSKGFKRFNILRPAGGVSGGGYWQVMKGRGSPGIIRRISHRTLLLPVLLMLAFVLPFMFLRVAYLVLESSSLCSSPLDCMRLRVFGGSDSSLLREELERALEEVHNNDEVGDGIAEVSPESFTDLVKDMVLNRQDIKAFAFKTKAMIMKMESKVQSARWHESVYWHLASHGVPKNLHCLHLKLAEEYAVNASARSSLPSPEYISRLKDSSFNHVVLLTDNVLAASVVISSTVKSSGNPEKLVFHVVTDKKTYSPMHSWFAMNIVASAVVEVKGLHQYDWSHEVNIGVKEMLEIHRLIWSHKYKYMKREDFEYLVDHEKDLEFLSPSFISLLNHLRIYIPELFPDLNKIVFLDDDVVVQRDLSSLWHLDLNGKIVGAVVDSFCGDGCCPGRKYKDYFNFSDPVISADLRPDRCGWLYGMNVFDLEAWRKTNITRTYHRWLKFNLDSGLELWNPGTLPPALIAFDGLVHDIDPSWHVAGLGYRSPQVSLQTLKAAAVVHFSGPAKPWLEIGIPEVRSLWTRHVNFSNKFFTKCRIEE
ncbi:Hexosyltransferase [Heracleum sosnowskyi]|uniref:Hexosyltransferase n=1 Tax=Heracleum sosnowskyi TaxID=360622 RepID=A0AAD8JLP1_9APIA|nr:Hexosyltransferase [Heracleum sosnowskyi]